MDFLDLDFILPPLIIHDVISSTASILSTTDGNGVKNCNLSTAVNKLVINTSEAFTISKLRCRSSWSFLEITGFSSAFGIGLSCGLLESSKVAMKISPKTQGDGEPTASSVT